MSPDVASSWGLSDTHATVRRTPGVVGPRVAEVVAWAALVDPGPDPSDQQHDRAVAALGEAADWDGELVHRAWLRALRALGEGHITRSSVSLLRAAADQLLDATALPATPYV
jgi:hypothetical protein